MQIGKTAAILAAAVLLLTGCGKSVAEVTTIAIQKNGKIEHVMIESFDEGSEEAFQEMLEEKVEEYNAGISGDSIEVKKVEEKGGILKVEMVYPTAADFDRFMNQDVADIDPSLRAPFFYGTVEEAFTEGYELNAVLYGVENDNLLRGKDDILPMGKNKMIIYDNRMNLGETVQISMPEALLYATDNAKILDKKLVEISDTDKLVYLILER